MAYLYDIFNVSNLEVTVTSNDILRVEIERSSASVRVGFICHYPTSDCRIHEDKCLKDLIMKGMLNDGD
jgi:hypothetical protein